MQKTVFLSWVLCHLEAELGVSEKSELKAKQSCVWFQPNWTFNWLFCGHSWILILLHKILNIVMYILIIIESNKFPINSNCNKCFQCELNSHPVRILLMWYWTSRSHSIWLSSGAALKKKKPVFCIELKIAVIILKNVVCWNWTCDPLEVMFITAFLWHWTVANGGMMKIIQHDSAFHWKAL